MSTNTHSDDIEYDELLAHLESKLAKIQARRTRLDVEEAAVQAMIASARQLQALSGETPVTATDSKPGANQAKPIKTLKNLSSTQAAKKYLAMISHPLTNRELVDGIIEHGFMTKASDPYTMVRSVLYRAMKDHHAFTWEDGKWGLPEWKSGHQTADAQQNLLIKGERESD